MYFFDIADYIANCAFGKYALSGGDPGDYWATYRATRNAWLKALNEYKLNFTACATCSSTIIGNIDVEIVNAFNTYQNIYSSDNYWVTYALFYNQATIVVNGVLKFSTIDEYNTQNGNFPQPSNFQFTEEIAFTDLHNVGVFIFGTSSITPNHYVYNVDFGDGQWNFEIFNNYLNLLIDMDCKFNKFFNLTTNNPQKSKMTNFNQIV